MKLYTFQESLDKYQANISRSKSAPRFGYPVLDAMIPGLLPGSLTVVAGATSMGKTTFMANAAYSMVAQQRKQVLFFSLESGHSISGIINKFHGDEAELLHDMAVMEGLSIIQPEERLGFDQVARTIKENLEVCDVAIIDHLHYLVQVKGSSSMQANVGDLVRSFQTLAKQTETPIVIVSHVRKLQTETAVPGLNDLKDSSALAQEPSNILFVHRFKQEAMDLAIGKDQAFQDHGVLLVAKNRDFGKTGTLALSFNPESMKFEVGGSWVGSQS